MKIIFKYFNVIPKNFFRQYLTERGKKDIIKWQPIILNKINNKKTN